MPWGTEIEFDFLITVRSTDGQDLDNVVVRDHFGAQLDLTCDQGLFGDDSTAAGSHTIGSGGGPRLKWEGFGLALSGPFSSATIVCTGTTNTAGGGQQQYTKCATKDLNSGPNAMATEEVLVGNPQEPKIMNQKRSANGDTIEVNITDNGAPGDCPND